MYILYFKQITTRVFQLGQMAVLYLLNYFCILSTGNMSLKSKGSPHPFPFYMCLFYLLTCLDPLKFVSQKDGCHSGIGRKRCFCK